MKLCPTLFRSAAIFGLLLFMAPGSRAASLNEAIARSQKTGAPLFVLVTTPYCVPCAVLKKRLATEEELQGLIKQYVGIHFDQSDPAYSQWTGKYKPRSVMVPMIFMVSASGKVIYNDSGAPKGVKLAKLLRYGLATNASDAEKAGTAKKAETKWRAVEKAARSVKAKDYGKAIHTLKPYLSEDKQQAAADQVRHADPLAALRAQLRQLGKTRLDNIRAKLASEDRQLFGLLALAKTRREFGELPELQAEIDDLYRQVREDADKTVWVEQVEIIDRGRAAEQAGDFDTAIDHYRQVMAQYPDAQASQLCTIRVRQITGGRLAVRSDADRNESQTR